MKKKYSFVLLVLVVFLFGSINTKYELRLDDSAYSRIWTDISFPKDTEAEQIASFNDVLISQYNHYMLWNGRTVTHVLVQGFCGLWGKTAYNWTATISFLLFLFFMGRIGTERKEMISTTILGMLLCAGLLFFAFPTPVDMYDGIAWGCNYLLTPMIVLGFYWVLMYVDLTQWWAKLLLIIFGLFAGWTHESAVLPLCGGLMVYAWINRKTIHAYKWAAMVMFGIGGLLMIICPGNLHRFLQYEDGNSGSLDSRMLVISSMWTVYLLLILMWLFGYRSKERIVSFFKENYILSISMVLSILLVLVIGALAPRFDYFINLFAALLILRLFKDKDALIARLGSICGIVLVLFLPFVYHYSVKAADQYARLDALMAPQHDEKEGFALLNTCQMPSYLTRFVDTYNNPSGWSPVWTQHKFNKEESIILTADNVKETNRFEDCFSMEHFKMKGDNPYYKIGFYCYSQDSLPSEMKIKIYFGDYRLTNPEGFARWCYSKIKGPLKELDGVVNTERITFQGKRYSRFYLHPNDAIEITGVDYVRE